MLGRVGICLAVESSVPQLCLPFILSYHLYDWKLSSSVSCVHYDRHWRQGLDS